MDHKILSNWYVIYICIDIDLVNLAQKASKWYTSWWFILISHVPWRHSSAWPINDRRSKLDGQLIVFHNLDTPTAWHSIAQGQRRFASFHHKTTGRGTRGVGLDCRFSDEQPLLDSAKTKLKPQGYCQWESSGATFDSQIQFCVDWVWALSSLADWAGLTFTYPEIATMIAANRIVIDSHREEFFLIPSKPFDRPVSAETRKKTPNARMIFIPSNPS